MNKSLGILLDSDVYLGKLFVELLDSLQKVVDTEENSEHINIVAKNTSREIDRKYKSALQVYNLSQVQLAQVLVDFYNQIKSDFYIIEVSNEKIVFGNRKCPFVEKIGDFPDICMMTSHMFGSIAAENLGYAKVDLQETIAKGNQGCRIVVYLRLTKEVENSSGIQYFK